MTKFAIIASEQSERGNLKSKNNAKLWIVTLFLRKWLAMISAKSQKTKRLKISKRHNALKNPFCKQKDELKLR